VDTEETYVPISTKKRPSPAQRNSNQRGKALYGTEYRGIRFREIAALFENVYDNFLLTSTLSYYVRAEYTAHPDQFLVENRAIIAKELAAAHSSLLLY